ncbi:ammonia transport outward protein 2 [Diutina catenulata]
MSHSNSTKTPGYDTESITSLDTENGMQSSAPIRYEDDDTMPVSSIKMTRTGDYVVIGRRKFKTTELAQAFGGTLNPGLAPYKHDNINPAPLGLAAFAFTTFCLSVYNCKGLGIHVPNVVVGAACFYGGAAQFLAGCGEFFTGNTFGNIALCSYGAFWLSYAAILVPSFGISAAYEDTDQMANATGFFLLGWALVTWMLVSVTVRSTVAFFSLFFCLAVTFSLLAAGEFTGKGGVTQAGGVVGLVTAVLGWYNAWAGVVTPSNAYFTQHPIPMPNFKKSHRA